MSKVTKHLGHSASGTAFRLSVHCLSSLSPFLFAVLPRRQYDARKENFISWLIFFLIGVGETPPLPSVCSTA